MMAALKAVCRSSCRWQDLPSLRVSIVPTRSSHNSEIYFVQFVSFAKRVQRAIRKREFSAITSVLVEKMGNENGHLLWQYIR